MSILRILLQNIFQTKILLILLTLTIIIVQSFLKMILDKNQFLYNND